MTDLAELDHLVVAATTLDVARSWVRDHLGVEPVTGGSHDGLGTHNVLVPLGARRYLEAIAIDPEAAPPTTPRWFGLDTDEVRQLIEAGPSLIAWVARCSGSDDAVDRLSRIPGYGPADVRPASRGALRWRFAFSPSGERFEHGLVPHLIQWDSPEHPTDRLPTPELGLTRLDLVAPAPAPLRALLDAAGLVQGELHVVPGRPQRLVATLSTASGGPVVVS